MVDRADDSEQFSNHVERYIGPIAGIFQEIIPDGLMINIVVVAPTPERNYYTLLTHGMSELAMTVPEGAEEFQYAELMISLPPTWQISDEAFQDERYYWPVRALKTLARFPHEHHTWLHMGHSLANDPYKPYSDDLKFQGMFLTLPDAEDKGGFFKLTLSDEKVVHFFKLVPIYKEELDYKIKHGMEALYEKLIKIGAHEGAELNRKNVCKKLFGIF